MAKTSLRVKQQRTPKYKTRAYNRCQLCGRPRGYYRDFGISRIALRDLVSFGMLPGVRKASW